MRYRRRDLVVAVVNHDKIIAAVTVVRNRDQIAVVAAAAHEIHNFTRAVAVAADKIYKFTRALILSSFTTIVITTDSPAIGWQLV